MPFFSIIVPAFNRERQLPRAINSVLAQDFESFEIIIIDDASTDQTLKVANSFQDSRIVVVGRETNGGPCQARNSGIAAARGEWLLMLDSDFSLKAGALASLRAQCEAASAKTGNCISACAWDNGTITPKPSPPAHLDYKDYLVWLDSVEISEYLNCIRREVFKDILYAKSRAWESSFHLALARRWHLEFSPQSFVTVHTDAANRLSASKGPAVYRRLLADASDKVDDALAILNEHESAMREWAPRRLIALRREIVRQALLAGRRSTALQAAWANVKMSAMDLRIFIIILIGVVHRSLLAWVSSQRVA